MTDHGYTAYSHGCRCDVCRAAKRAYSRARRAAGAEPTRCGVVPRPEWHQPLPFQQGNSRVGVSRVRLPILNHGRTGYRRGCRCWDCTDAESAAALQRARRRAQESA